MATAAARFDDAVLSFANPSSSESAQLQALSEIRGAIASGSVSFWRSLTHTHTLAQTAASSSSGPSSGSSSDRPEALARLLGGTDGDHDDDDKTRDRATLLVAEMLEHLEPLHRHVCTDSERACIDTLAEFLAARASADPPSAASAFLALEALARFAQRSRSSAATARGLLRLVVSAFPGDGGDSGVRARPLAVRIARARALAMASACCAAIPAAETAADPLGDVLPLRGSFQLPALPLPPSSRPSDAALAALESAVSDDAAPLSEDEQRELCLLLDEEASVAEAAIAAVSTAAAALLNEKDPRVLLILLRASSIVATLLPPPPPALSSAATAALMQQQAPSGADLLDEASRRAIRSLAEAWSSSCSTLGSSESFSSGDLERQPAATLLFRRLSSFFPITFTPPPPHQDRFRITAAALANELAAALGASSAQALASGSTTVMQASLSTLFLPVVRRAAGANAIGGGGDDGDDDDDDGGGSTENERRRTLGYVAAARAVRDIVQRFRVATAAPGAELQVTKTVIAGIYARAESGESALALPARQLLSLLRLWQARRARRLPVIPAALATPAEDLTSLVPPAGIGARGSLGRDPQVRRGSGSAFDRVPGVGEAAMGGLEDRCAVALGPHWRRLVIAARVEPTLEVCRHRSRRYAAALAARTGCRRQLNCREYSAASGRRAISDRIPSSAPQDSAGDAAGGRDASDRSNCHFGHSWCCRRHAGAMSPGSRCVGPSR